MADNNTEELGQPAPSSSNLADSNGGGGGGNFSSGFFSVGKYGTYMSLIVLVLGMVLSMLTQRYAPSYINLDTWEDGCSDKYLNDCKASSAVLRVSFALTIFFITQCVGSFIYARYFDVLWGIKITIFCLLVVGFFFVESSVFGLDGYAWFARITGFMYLILQQIILLDIAYTWNERWLAYSTEEGERGKLWLVGLVVISGLLFIGSYAFIGIMYWQFDKCENNVIIISLTLGLSLIATIIQLFFTDQGSILTSAILTSYATYVCYSAISLNPNISCNPALDTDYQTISTAIGMTLMVISLSWTSYNAVKKIPSASGEGGRIDLTNIATGGTQSSPHDQSAAAVAGAEDSTADAYSRPGMKSLFVQVSFVFMLISGYYAMVLTNWATLQADDSIEDPRTGKAAMWIQSCGQWIAVGVYLWSLIAPKIFPNRDFGE